MNSDYLDYDDVSGIFLILFLYLCVSALPLSVNKASSSATTLHSLQVRLPKPPSMQQAVSVWVRDPRIQKTDFWHAYIDYEICLHVSKQELKMRKIAVLTPVI